MSLSNMAVFNTWYAPAIIETLDQMVEKFNGASNGAIRLSTEGFSGDFREESLWASIGASQRRVDRYAANGAVAATDMTQIENSSVKVAGAVGPLAFEPSQLTWLQKPSAEAAEVISREVANLIMQDMLNASIASAVAAITTAGTTVVGAVSHNTLNSAHALFGDHSSLIVADVMNGATYHSLIDLNITNASDLYRASGVQIVDILGKVIVVTDAPALTDTALGLVAGGIVVTDAGDMVSNIDTSNGNERIETTYQADYSFGVGLKGFSWDQANGGASPTDAELATGTNWDQTATSVKHTAGVAVVPV